MTLQNMIRRPFDQIVKDQISDPPRSIRSARHESPQPPRVGSWGPW